MFTELKQIEKVQMDSYHLQKKIDQLQKRNVKNLKKTKKRRTAPKGQNKLFKRENKYEDINSKINLDAEKVKQTILDRTQNNIDMKINYELEKCTFMPEINNRSKLMAKTYIPPHEKELKRPKVENITDANNLKKSKKKKKPVMNHKKKKMKKEEVKLRNKDRAKNNMKSQMTNQKLVSKLNKMYKKL